MNFGKYNLNNLIVKLNYIYIDLHLNEIFKMGFHKA